MRRVKSKERELAGNIYCSFCRPMKVDAVWRKSGYATHSNGFACEDHKSLIKDEKLEDLSEADYQTWMRL